MRKVGWFDIYVDDMERAQAFYETVLDTTVSPMDDPNDPTAQMRAFGDDFTSHGAGGGWYQNAPYPAATLMACVAGSDPLALHL